MLGSLQCRDLTSVCFGFWWELQLAEVQRKAFRIQICFQSQDLLPLSVTENPGSESLKEPWPGQSRGGLAVEMLCSLGSVGAAGSPSPARCCWNSWERTLRLADPRRRDGTGGSSAGAPSRESFGNDFAGMSSAVLKGREEGGSGETIIRFKAIMS